MLYQLCVCEDVSPRFVEYLWRKSPGVATNRPVVLRRNSECLLLLLPALRLGSRCANSKFAILLAIAACKHWSIDDDDETAAPNGDETLLRVPAGVRQNKCCLGRMPSSVPVGNRHSSMGPIWGPNKICDGAKEAKSRVYLGWRPVFR